MNPYVRLYFHCPECAAILTGKHLESPAIQCTELYSDGKMMCDELLSEPQMIVVCPSCGHIFWVIDPASPEKTLIPSFKELPTKQQKVAVYPYSSWYLFGSNTYRTFGKLALIHQYSHLLTSFRPLSAEKELYLRKGLLWAHNDLVRKTSSYKFMDFLKGDVSFSTWRHDRKHRMIYKYQFLKHLPAYKANIKRMIEILRSSPEREVEKVYLAELYRLKGDFTKSLELITELNRSTHFVNIIRNKALKKVSTVFKVAG
ncbi:MAG: hypothetical protein IT219_07625 [Bacteroidales bacterium]|nr:hypothetical protein [Bacteroidales bacterium]